MSKYPPGTGLVLAFGQRLFGHPILGIWIFSSLMCSTVYWMLLAWFPPLWALIGAGYTIIAYITSGFWTHTYIGPAVPALGGILLLGGARRMLRDHRYSNGIVTGTGIAILANTRPYEGLIATIAVLFSIAWTLSPPKNTTARQKTKYALLSMIAVLTINFSWMAYYNFRATGNPLLLPYQHFVNDYFPAGEFYNAGNHRDIKYQHEILEKFYTSEYMVKNRESARGWWDRRHTLKKRWRKISSRHFQPFGQFFILLVPFIVISKTLRFPVFTFFLGVLGNSFTKHYYQHYLAPFSAFAILVMIGVLKYFVTGVNMAIGRLRVRYEEHLVKRIFLVAGFVILVALLYASTAHIHRRVTEISERISVSTNRMWHRQRAVMLKRMEDRATSQLIFVRYGPRHNAAQEWVYNSADIDNSQVVWARYMDEKTNQKLIHYFKGREIWLLDIDPEDLEGHYRLMPYPI